MVDKIRRSLANYIRIMKTLGSPKKEIEIIEKLLFLVQENPEIIDRLINSQPNNEGREKPENVYISYAHKLKSINSEIVKSVELARKLENIVLNAEDDIFLEGFLDKNKMLRQFINVNERESYEILTKYNYSDFKISELQFLYLYILRETEMPKYDNKLNLFKMLTSMIYQRIYMNSFKVEN